MALFTHMCVACVWLTHVPGSHYIKRLCLACSQRGWRVCVFSYWRLEWMETRDMEYAIEFIAATYPDAAISAIACSAGAHVLVPYMAHCGRSGISPLVCAATISGCLDFQKTYEFVATSQGSFYKDMLNNAMKRCVYRHHSTDEHSKIDETKLNHLLSIKRADVMYDRHLSTLDEFHGADPRNPRAPATNSRVSSVSSDEAWFSAVTNAQTCSFPLQETLGHYTTPARLAVSEIKTHTLMIHARDDTLVPYDWAVDWDRARENQHIISVATQRGGHVGFHEWKGWLTGLTWAEQITVDYISTMLSINAQTGFMLDVFERSRRTDGVPNQLKPSEISALCSTSNVAANSAPPQHPPARFFSAHRSLNRMSSSFLSSTGLDHDLSHSSERASEPLFF